MIRNSVVEQLELMGVTLTDSEFQIIQAMIDLGFQGQREVTYSGIRKYLEKQFKDVPSKQWLYKCLNNLVEADFIEIEPIPRPAKYRTSVDKIMEGLDKARLLRTREIEQEIEALEKEIAAVRDVSLHQLSRYIQEELGGKETQTLVTVVEGVSNVRKSFISELCTDIKDESVLSISNNVPLIDIENIETGTIESELLEAAKQGLTIRILSSVDRLKIMGQSEETMNFIRKNLKVVLTLMEKGRVALRQTHLQQSTYRVACFKDGYDPDLDRIMLFLTDNPGPDTVAIIYRKKNPKLIENAFASFEKAWEESQDISNLVKKMCEDL